MLQNIILIILSHCRYRDIIKFRRLNKSFKCILSSDFFMKEFYRRRTNVKLYKLNIWLSSHIMNYQYIVNESDITDMIEEYLFRNHLAIEYFTYEDMSVLRTYDDSIFVYQSARETWKIELAYVDMHNSSVSENDGLTEEDYNPETGEPYYYEQIIVEPIFDESFLPVVSKQYAHILKSQNVSIQ